MPERKVVGFKNLDNFRIQSFLSFFWKFRVWEVRKRTHFGLAVTGQTGDGHRLDRSCATEAVAASRRLCSHASPRRSFPSPLKPSRSTREQNSIWPLHPRSSEPSTLLARPERTPPLPWPPPRQTPCSVPPPPETTLQRVSSRRPGPLAYCRRRTPWPPAGPAPLRSTPGPPPLELSPLNQSPMAPWSSTARPRPLSFTGALPPRSSTTAAPHCSPPVPFPAAPTPSATTRYLPSYSSLSTPPPLPATLALAGIAVLHVPLLKNRNQGLCAAIELSPGAFLHCHRLIWIVLRRVFLKNWLKLWKFIVNGRKILKYQMKTFWNPHKNMYPLEP